VLVQERRKEEQEALDAERRRQDYMDRMAKDQEQQERQRQLGYWAKKETGNGWVFIKVPGARGDSKSVLGWSPRLRWLVQSLSRPLLANA
jgi:hypothetical protein